MYAHGREAVISHLVAGRGVTARGAPRRHARGTHGGRFARPDRQTDRQTLSVCLICLILILSYLMCAPRPLKCPPPFTAARADGGYVERRPAHACRRAATTARPASDHPAATWRHGAHRPRRWPSTGRQRSRAHGGPQLPRAFSHVEIKADVAGQHERGPSG